jgi:hypothetical protein
MKYPANISARAINRIDSMSFPVAGRTGVTVRFFGATVV